MGKYLENYFFTIFTTEMLHEILIFLLILANLILAYLFQLFLHFPGLNFILNFIFWQALPNKLLLYVSLRFSIYYTSLSILQIEQVKNNSRLSFL